MSAEIVARLRQVIAAEQALARAAGGAGNPAEQAPSPEQVVAAFDGLAVAAVALDEQGRELARGGLDAAGATVLATVADREGLAGLLRGDRSHCWRERDSGDGTRLRIDAVAMRWPGGPGALWVQRPPARPGGEATARAQVSSTDFDPAHLRLAESLCNAIVHDVGNAMVPIACFVDVLLETASSRLPDSGVEHLGAMREAAAEVQAILARLQGFQMHTDAAILAGPVDLNALLRQAPALAARAGDDAGQADAVELVWALDQALPSVYGPPEALHAAVDALVANALEAMPAGGRLTLRTGAAPGTQGAACVALTVMDTGAGMDARTLARCMEPFFTTRSGRARGLGLALAHAVMSSAGGSVRIESEPGYGTTASLLFPAPATPL